MKRKNSGENAIILENPAVNTQTHMIVDGCKVRLNFPSKSEGSEVNDVKRMILGSAIKT